MNLASKRSAVAKKDAQRECQNTIILVFQVEYNLYQKNEKMIKKSSEFFHKNWNRYKNLLFLQDKAAEKKSVSIQLNNLKKPLIKETCSPPISRRTLCFTLQNVVSHHR